ncbi:hypothetical protein [Streptobacillus canis]|uniref:hypothetical protein n=1 Tax=Streptobacillus canis TaxID=2678686 RepID=UPI0012E13A54|nr:hypothetical protein [Streptobacillus canis]
MIIEIYNIDLRKCEYRVIGKIDESKFKVVTKIFENKNNIEIEKLYYKYINKEIEEIKELSSGIEGFLNLNIVETKDDLLPIENYTNSQPYSSLVRFEI